ncbi:Homeodomain-like domain protein [compost metagenome]
MTRPTISLVLTLTDAEILQGWLRMTSLPQSRVQRARILLRLADGHSPKEISEQLQISAPVVCKWRRRYQEAGLEGLNDLSRSGHLNPPDNVQVLSVDEKTQIRGLPPAHAAAQIRAIERRTYDCKRHGTVRMLPLTSWRALSIIL